MPTGNTSKNYPYVVSQNVTTTIFSIQNEFSLHISIENNRKTFVSLVCFQFIIKKKKLFLHTDTKMYPLVNAAKCRTFVCVLVL